MVRGKCALGRGLGPSPQENVSVPLFKHIHQCLLTGKSLLYAIIIYNHLHACTTGLATVVRYVYMCAHLIFPYNLIVLCM